MKESAAVFAPELDGVNVTETLQVAFGASEVTHVFAVIANMDAFVPVSATAEMVSVAPPVFVTVVESAALVTSTRVLGKAIEAGLKPIAALPAPTPETGTLCGDPAALSVKTIADDLFPDAAGVKTTLTVHVPPLGATLAHPVGVGAKSPALVP